MPDVNRASELVQETLDQFDAAGMSVAALVRRCQRIASLRGDAIALAWLTLESTDLTTVPDSPGGAKGERLAARLLKEVPAAEAGARWTAEYQAYLSRRRIKPGASEANLRSVQQTEDLIGTLREQEAAVMAPAPPGMHTYDLGKHVSDQQKVKSCGVVYETNPSSGVSLGADGDLLGCR